MQTTISYKNAIQVFFQSNQNTFQMNLIKLIPEQINTQSHRIVKKNELQVKASADIEIGTSFLILNE